MTKIALVETKPSRTNFSTEFDNKFEFDQYQLCSDPVIKKVLKRDCDIEIDLDIYDWVILVGSDAVKYFTKITSITEYSGRKVEEKFLPIINPAMLAFKPEAKTVWESSKNNIIDYISGNKEDIAVDSTMVEGIETEERAIEYLLEALAHPSPVFGIDSETTALYPRDGYILGVSLSYDAKKGVYISTDCFTEEVERLLARLLQEKTPVFHNAKFDIAFFEYHFNVRITDFEDTMLLHYLIDETPGTHGLKSLALKYTPFGDYEKEQYDWMAAYRKEHGMLKADFTWDLIPFDTMKKYASMDALVTLQLFNKFVAIKKHSKHKKVYDTILIPGTRFLIDTQDNGVPFNRERLQKGQDLMQLEVDEAVATLYKHPEVKKFEEEQGKEFNPNSTVQLRVLLFDYLGIKPTGKKTQTGAHSTDAEVLTELSSISEVPGLILNIRQKSKIKNTYLDKIIPQLNKDSRLRTNFNLHTTTSGRLSSSGKLNMQQLPRDNAIVKGCIQARSEDYKIVAMDLTTAEVYVAACLAEDEELKNVFRSGGNFHSNIAKKVFKLNCSIEDIPIMYPTERQAAKAVTFGIIYGAGSNKISSEVTKSSGTYFSKKEAQEVIDEYFQSFSTLKKWIEQNQRFIEQNAFIYSHFGRKRRLPNVKSKDAATKSHNIRSGINFLVQSVASDINLLGAVDTADYISRNNLDAKIFALVHDSILAEVHVNHVEQYSEALKCNVQVDRGLIIEGCPIGCDFEIGSDYSMGKFEKQYPELSVSNL